MSLRGKTHISPYEDHLADQTAVSFETCGAILAALIAAADVHDKAFIEDWESFVTEAIAYSRIRAEFNLLDLATMTARSAQRTAKHNAVISTLQAVVMSIQAQGGDISRATQLGIDLAARTHAKEKPYRRMVGDFANYIAYVNALATRNV